MYKISILLFFTLLFLYVYTQNTTTGFHKEIFDLQNEKRVKHGGYKLFWDPELNQLAQKYSKKMAALGKVQRSGNGYGENLYGINGTKPMASTIVDTWYNESLIYTYNPPFFNPKALNFTSMIWRNSEYVGIGSSKDTSGFWAIVVFYFPPNNIRGRFKFNVFPPK